jgi:hypothetical protein
MSGELRPLRERIAELRCVIAGKEQEIASLRAALDALEDELALSDEAADGR